MSDSTGILYWRSVEQLADAPEIRDAIEREFPGYDADTIATTSRRSFLKLMAASLALAGVGLTGCRRVPQNKLAPYAAAPRDRVPGVPEHYATQFELNGYASGLLVTCYDGRPIKVEGNPSHPFSRTIPGKLGAADAFAQASVLGLYEPQRSRTIVERKDRQRVVSNWKAFNAFAGPHFANLRRDAKGLAVLAEPASGPTALDMKRRFLETFPDAAWYEYDPLSRDNELVASRLLYKRSLRPVLHLEKAKAAVLLDADLLGSGPAKLRYAADWAEGRRSADSSGSMIRVYAAECGFSVTGAVADKRLPTTPDRLEAIARAIGEKAGVPRMTATSPLTPDEQKFVDAAAKDLTAAGADAVLAVGPSAPPEVHAVAMLVNSHLKATGNTVTLHGDPAGERLTHFEGITELASRMGAGMISTLLVIGGNPAYDAPADLDLASLIARVPVSVRLGQYDDETSAVCGWHVPQAHYLEAWNDARALDGTPGVCQPLIEPLFGGKSNIELLATLSGDEFDAGEDLVRRTWEPMLGDDFEKKFRKVLEAGAHPDAAETSIGNPRPRITTVNPGREMPRGTTPFLKFEPDSRVHDGRFAGNAWLQETPEPLTKLVWENALLMNARDAEAAGLAAGDWAVLTLDKGVVSAPVFILPGQPQGVMSLSVGYGRLAGGSVAVGLGSNAYLLRQAMSPNYSGAVTLSKGYGSHTLATTQNHHILDAVGKHGLEHKVGQRGESGEIIREASLAEYKADPKFAGKTGGHKISLQLFEPPHKFNSPHAWGMSVDLNACIGCNACAVACQSENNIPVVGREQVLVHRQMNWMRVDRYFKGDTASDPANVDVVFQPVMCQHCENAPCEQVCPATATVHDTEGLNTMVYNRCIGTRYCSNNCAYKVRRFNYFDFHSKDPRADVGSPYAGIPDTQQNEQVDPVRQMAMNPEVTVRMRGVMEKCTFCVQRIHSATIAKRAAGGNTVADGEVVTACQQACPTQAIVFGNLNDHEAAVHKQHANPRSYELLAELNNRPRTRYLAKLRNPPTEA